jgi:hypothetical protein
MVQTAPMAKICHCGNWGRECFRFLRKSSRDTKVKIPTYESDTWGTRLSPGTRILHPSRVAQKAGRAERPERTTFGLKERSGMFPAMSPTTKYFPFLVSQFSLHLFFV